MSDHDEDNGDTGVLPIFFYKIFVSSETSQFYILHPKI